MDKGPTLLSAADNCLETLSPASNRSCCTMEIARLLEPKRNFLAGRFKSPNRWRWLAHR